MSYSIKNTGTGTKGKCPKCGATVDVTRRYCTKCGALLQDPVETGSDALAGYSEDRQSVNKAEDAQQGKQGMFSSLKQLFSRKNKDSVQLNSAVEIENKFKEGSSDGGDGSCPQCSSVVSRGQRFCLVCGYEFTEASGSLDVVEEEEAPLTTNMESSWGFGGEREPADNDDERFTTVLSQEYDEATTVLDDGLSIITRLVRVRTGESYDLDLPSVVGKGSAVDCQIIGNSAISRQHVKIEQTASDSGVYKLSVLGATNKTLVDGVVIATGNSTGISDGQVITLADEDFEFRILESSLGSPTAAG